MNTKFHDLGEVIAHLKGKINIVDVMTPEVDLIKAGGDLYKAVCCFHEERTPSLTVTPSKGLYHCFGCKASGDIISYYRDKYNMSTTEAVRALAERFRIDLSRFERELSDEEKAKAEMLRINRVSRDSMHTLLMSGGRGYDYLAGRGVTDEAMVDFGLGYARHAGDAMLRHSVTIAHILQLDRDDMFTDSVVYPLHDAFGQVVGFKARPYWGGKHVDERGQKYPKFLGTSSASPLHMDGHIYGLHIARKHMPKGRLIGVEGQHDVITAHMADIKYTVGMDGTALNQEKVDMLEEFGVRELVVAYDGDNAGREASLKVAQAMADIKTTIAVKIARMPEGKDPDEYIREHGPLSFLRVISEAVYASQYLIDQIAEEIPLANVTQRIDFIKRCQPIILQAPAFEQRFLMAYVAERIGIDEMVIEDMIRSEQAKHAKSLLYNIDGEELVLGAMIRDEEFRHEALIEMSKGDWYTPRHQEIFAMVKDMNHNSVPVNIDTLKIAMNNRGLKQLLLDGAVLDKLITLTGDHRHTLEDLKDKAIRRAVIRRAEDLQVQARDLSTRVPIVIEHHLTGLQQSAASSHGENVMDGKKGATGFMTTLHQRMENPGKIVGIDLGPQYRSLTKALNGLQKQCLITLAANQSVGKTTLLANWMDEIAIVQRQPWLHFSLEMPSRQMTQKMIAIRAGVDSMRIQTGNLTDEEYGRVQQAAMAYYNGALLMEDQATTLEQILSMTRKYQRTHNIIGVSIDYIQLMSIETRRSHKKYEEEGQISGALKNDLAKKLDLPCVILSQMSRGAKDKDIATAEDGAGAYKISQDSDVYMILSDKKQAEIEKYGIEKGNQTLFLDKNRMGTADLLLDILFQKEIQRMQEIA